MSPGQSLLISALLFLIAAVGFSIIGIINQRRTLNQGDGK